MSLIYKLLHEFIAELNQQQHPLVLLNHLFHDTDNISYNKELQQPIAARSEVLQSANIEKINEIYNLYVQDVAVLQEALKNSKIPGVSEDNKKNYSEQLKDFAITLEGVPLFDRQQAIRNIVPKFEKLLSNIAHDAAWARYQELSSSVPESREDAQEAASKVTELITSIIDTVNNGVEISKKSDAPKDEIIRAIGAIKQWQDEYEGLPLEEAARITKVLNNEESYQNLFQSLTTESMEGDSSELHQTAKTFEYRLADLYSCLYEKNLTPEADALFDLQFLVEFKYLSGHLYNTLNQRSGKSKFGAEVECYVRPNEIPCSQEDSSASFSGLTVRSYGTIVLKARENNDVSDTESTVSGTTDTSDMSTASTFSAPREIVYSEYVDKSGKIALINNTVSGKLSSSEMNTILSEQAKYLKHTENKQTLSDDFVFRIEFKSQEQFDKYQENGRLKEMLKDFAKKHSDFKIKVVITGSPAKNETVKRYASFNELFSNAQASLKKKSSLTATEEPLGSSFNVRRPGT